MDNKEAFRQKLNAKLEEYKAEFDKLTAQTKGAYAEGKLEGSREGKDIKAKLEDAKLKLKQLEDAGEDSWKDLKADMEQTWDNLKDNLNKIKK